MKIESVILVARIFDSPRALDLRERGLVLTAIERQYLTRPLELRR